MSAYDGTANVADNACVLIRAALVLVNIPGIAQTLHGLGNLAYGKGDLDGAHAGGKQKCLDIVLRNRG
ncbi:MAG TPA: hypothetical protein VMY43_09310 [Methanothrix sp.]|nr:hypothetical protein [Methanothrix sp.]